MRTRRISPKGAAASEARDSSLRALAADVVAHYEGRSVRGSSVRAVLNPSIRACGWIRVVGSGSRVAAYVARSRLIAGYSIDVAQGAVVGPGLRLPHPVGIVIGDGVRIGSNVTIYHGVTLGASRGGYPVLEDDVVVYPGATVVGGTRVGRGAIVGANCFVAADVEPGSRVPGGTRFA